MNKKIFLLAGLTMLLAACKPAPAPEPEPDPAVTPATEKTAPAADTGTLTDEEMNAQVPEIPEALQPKPIAAAQARSVKIRLVSERGYDNERRQHVVDILERDYAYIVVLIETPDGRPVQGAKPEIVAIGSSRVQAVSEASATGLTDETGMVEFGIVAGKMGADHVTVSFRDAKAEVMVNVISLAASGYPIPQVEGAITWDELAAAKLRYVDEAVEADFSAALLARDQKTAKIVGFMMPLEPEQKQKRFLLTSNPPSCFFHIPGGPAGAVEVFSRQGIAPSWDPIVMEGRLEIVRRNEQMGVIYRLRDAKLIKP